ncbi:MAG: hypothetical protein AAFU55_15895, partial [Pseudomonadota bacterium]
MPNWGRLIASRLFFAVFLALALQTGGADAQNYGIFNQSSDDAAGEAQSAAGSDSEASPEADPGGDPALDEDPGGPDLAAYGQVAEVYERESALQATQQQVGVFRQKARRIFGAADRYVEKLDRTLDEASPTGRSTYFLGVLLFTAILIAIGRAVTMVYAMYVALPVMRRVQSPDPRGIVDKLPV